ncbi:MAG: hypothetical protein CMJ42_19010 [Phyllobacteriaceae bacterium]|nr:hypothetical protein [Phyllobacteriaceae bacterium]MBA92023.1 hypothetical protein [Phyllobacteriaceae bacterium]
MTSFPKSSTRIGQGAGDDPLAAAFQYEAAADMAVSLGMAGRRVEAALAALRRTARDDPSRPDRLKDAARAVHAYFIQRELIGLRRHDALIREMGIPREVLVRLGAC